MNWEAIGAIGEFLGGVVVPSRRVPKFDELSPWWAAQRHRQSWYSRRKHWIRSECRSVIADEMNRSDVVPNWYLSQ